ncbi:hydroxyacid dehydrogenase [Acidilutibacter cellobiosedens]|uniref:Hydroxyacid dehydrogenase n=1 Tax=Acidilutibacter cellobiosedens TaxID=2507161 RepID=A0A410QDE0_9FIRM|nr:NAD(P)-dependent oxidoreductase [Acidilutibacter cellobiosedens]QAT61884.1 hydroxyacid dehydrogenase [Acidilutibacter cellobiosedens]
MKIKLALGTKLEQPYYDRVAEVCDIKKVGSLLNEGFIGEEELIEQCMGCEIIYIGSDLVTRRCLEKWKSAGLKLLGCGRGTPVNVDCQAARELNIPLVYCPGRNAQSVAEFTVGLMLALVRNIGMSCSKINDGTLLGDKVEDIYRTEGKKDVLWKNDKIFVRDIIPSGQELYGKTLGIVGFGAIGSKVGKIAKTFNMDVNVYDPFCPKKIIEEAGVKPCNLEELLINSDIITIHLPANDSTIGLIDSTWFEKMKPTSFLINTSRASVIEQKALIKALDNNQIAGAAMDVMWIEPCPKNHPLLHRDNVIITPHIAGWTYGVYLWQSRMICDEIIRYANNQEPQLVWKK